MKVAELIEQLQKYPRDATVIMTKQIDYDAALDLPIISAIFEEKYEYNTNVPTPYWSDEGIVVGPVVKLD